MVLFAALVLLAALATAPLLVTGGPAPAGGSSTVVNSDGPVTSAVEAAAVVRKLDPAFVSLPVRDPSANQSGWVDVLPSGSQPGAFEVEVQVDGLSFFYTVEQDGTVTKR